MSKMQQKILPDGADLTKARQHVIETGYDHYWRFHDKPEDWVPFGCPICISLAERNRRLANGETWDDIDRGRDYAKENLELFGRANIPARTFEGGEEQ